MSKRVLARSYGRTLSAIAVPVLLLAMTVLAGSAQSADGYQNADHPDGQMAIRASQRSVFSQRAGLPAATVPNSTDGGTAEALRDTETTDFTEAGHPFSANPFRRRQSAPSRARRGADHPSANPLRRRQSADHPSVDHPSATQSPIPGLAWTCYLEAIYSLGVCGNIESIALSGTDNGWAAENHGTILPLTSFSGANGMIL